MIKKSLLVFCFIYSYSYAASYNLVSIYDVMKHDSFIEYLKCHDPIPFNYKPLPLPVDSTPLRPHKGLFAETFVLKIPNGQVFSEYGLLAFGNNIIQELLPQNMFDFHYINILKQFNIQNQQPKRIRGKVAVLARPNSDIYGHWIGEFLGRLALLEMQGVEYDWLYVPYNKRYIKETLALLGIDAQKIIEPAGDNFYIQADELIVPSLTVRRVPSVGENNFFRFHSLNMFCPHWNLYWLRSKFLPLIEQLRHKYDFSKKVFISRKDASMRRVTNEDEVFALFEAKGFKKYSLEKMSFLEQIILFSGAKTIVGTHGSGLMNILFCNPGTHIVEIYQNQYDSTFWQLSQTVGLHHYCIKTQAINHTNGTLKDDTEVPILIIQQYLEEQGQDL